jgi:hypothetical protein
MTPISQDKLASRTTVIHFRTVIMGKLLGSTVQQADFHIHRTGNDEKSA